MPKRILAFVGSIFVFAPLLQLALKRFVTYSPERLDEIVSSERFLERLSVDVGPRIVFLPSNYYNAGTIEQAFLYNGLLGGSPAKFIAEERFRCVRPTPLVKDLFGDVLLLGGDSSSLKLLESAIRGGVAVVWATVDATHDPEKQFEPIRRLVASPDVEIRRFQISNIAAEHVPIAIARLAHPTVRQHCLVQVLSLPPWLYLGR